MEEILDEGEQIFEGKVPKIIKASLIMRIKSSIIDTVVLIFLMYLASIFLEKTGFKSIIMRGSIFLLVWLYEPILVTLNRTLGQKIMGLRVRKFSDLKNGNLKTNINIFYSITRYFSKLLLGWISLLTIHSDDYGRAIHDKIGNSVMTIE